MAPARKTKARKFTLRDAQKADTHQRMIDAARTVFGRDGYYGATIDRIVVEAGASRPTFYLHFKDKEEILAELVADHLVRGAPFMERLPGPRPTLGQVRSWLLDFGKFVEEQRTLYMVLTEVSGHQPASGGVHHGIRIMEEWVRVLATRSPSFAAADSGKDVNAKATALLLLTGLAWVGGIVASDGASAFTQETLATVADAWFRFLNHPRFHVAGTNGAKRRTTNSSRETTHPRNRSKQSSKRSSAR
jgi:AcrR family transcriptional regulator